MVGSCFRLGGQEKPLLIDLSGKDKAWFTKLTSCHRWKNNSKHLLSNWTRCVKNLLLLQHKTIQHMGVACPILQIKKNLSFKSYLSKVTQLVNGQEVWHPGPSDSRIRISTLPLWLKGAGRHRLALGLTITSLGTCSPTPSISQFSFSHICTQIILLHLPSWHLT